MLAGGDRHLEPSAEIGEPGDVRVMDGVLEPGDAGVLQDATGPACLGHRPAFDGVDHDAHIRPDGVAHGLDAPRLHLGRRFLAEPQLHRAESVGHVLLRRRRELAGGEADPQAVARVGWKAIAEAAEETIERLAERLAVGVPHGDVERRERAVQQAAGPDPVSAPRELAPGGLRLEHAHADQVLAELARRGADRGHQIGPGIDDVADAFGAVCRRDAGQHVPVRVDRPPAGDVRTIDGYPHDLDRDLRDLHVGLRARGCAR